jgi:hypothetical protein
MDELTKHELVELAAAGDRLVRAIYHGGAAFVRGMPEGVAEAYMHACKVYGIDAEHRARWHDEIVSFTRHVSADGKTLTVRAVDPIEEDGEGHGRVDHGA